jgi:hypothetical protein
MHRTNALVIAMATSTFLEARHCQTDPAAGCEAPAPVVGLTLEDTGIGRKLSSSRESAMMGFFIAEAAASSDNIVVDIDVRESIVHLLAY